MVTKQYNFRLIVPVIICLLLISTIVFDACTTQPAPVIPPTTQPAPIIPPTTPTPVLPNDELKVYFIDVGQGDSILIDSGDTEVLIDGGDKAPGAVSFLKNEVDGALEVMVATHPHADHIGGLNAVLANFKVDDIWLNGDTRASYNDLMPAINAEGANVYIAKRGDLIKAGDLTLDVLNPAEPLLDSINNRSIVLLLHYGDIDFLFTGDAEKQAEANMLAAGLITDVEVLKVGHHGSQTASSVPFLEACRPEVAVYMAGKGNSFGHPNQETITALTNIGAEICGTDVNGNICITTDGKAYTAQTDK